MIGYFRQYFLGHPEYNRNIVQVQNNPHCNSTGNFVVRGYYSRLTSLDSWAHTCRFCDLQNTILVQEDVTGCLELLAPTKAVRLRFHVVHVRIVSLRVLRLPCNNEGYRSHIMPPVTILQCSMTIHLSPIACLPKTEAKFFRISRGDVKQ
jgi:hypothetical protein